MGYGAKKRDKPVLNGYVILVLKVNAPDVFFYEYY